MSKNLTQTKSDMGYIEKPVHPCCWNCSSYTLKRVVIGVCTLGKFKTFKTATCSKHEFITHKTKSNEHSR